MLMFSTLPGVMITTIAQCCHIRNFEHFGWLHRRSRKGVLVKFLFHQDSYMYFNCCNFNLTTTSISVISTWPPWATYKLYTELSVDWVLFYVTHAMIYKPIKQQIMPCMCLHIISVQQNVTKNKTRHIDIKTEKSYFVYKKCTFIPKCSHEDQSWHWTIVSDGWQRIRLRWNKLPVYSIWYQILMMTT